MQTTTKTRIVAGAAVVALAAAGCGSKSTAKPGAGAATTTTAATSAATSAATTTAAAANFHACMVTDTGGIDDKSFNASAWAGMKAAESDGKAKVDYLASTTSNDYVPNITKLEAQSCDLIVTVGGLMGPATYQAAAAKADQKFAIVDSGPTDFSATPNVTYKNVHGLQFNTAQGAFLAGYVAAGTSKTGVVGTWGGLKIPPVTVYMDGFAEGVAYYNKQKSKNVKVLGWDEAAQNGSFAGSFTDTNKGKSLTDGMANQGADIIFPVAGGAGNGATASAKASNGKISVIWVDTDGCVSDAADCPVFLGSVTKGISTAVKQVVEDAASGKFTGGDSTNLNLATNGTAFVPGTAIGGNIPADVTADLAKITSDIASGAITITSPSQPK